MKIVYLITKSEAGGAQTHVYQLCRYFSSQGHEVVVMAYPGGWLEEQCATMEVTFVGNQYLSNHLNPFKLFKALWLVRKLMKEWKPDIVHCHSSAAGFIGRVAVRNKIPTLFTAHGWGFNVGVGTFQKWLAIIAEKIAGRYTSKIICVSNFVKELALRYNIVGENKLEVIHNGVEKVVVTSDEDDTIQIIFVGRFAEPKQPMLLLQAYAKLPESLQSKTRLVFVGDGPKKRELMRCVEVENLRSVSFLGSLPREAVFANLAQSDIFVLLSAWEGLPYSILEAMSVGLPVIASDVGGISDAVVNGKTGFLIKNKVEQVASSLGVLINNEQIRKEMGVAAKLKIEQHFSNEKMLHSIEQLYKNSI